jgi:hypothetical protein
VSWLSGGAEALAQRALDEAGEAKRDAAVLLVQLQAHVDGCGRNWASLERRLEESRADSQEWRVGLGETLKEQNARVDKRADRIERIAWSVLTGTIFLLVTFILQQVHVIPGVTH